MRCHLEAAKLCNVLSLSLKVRNCILVKSEKIHIEMKNNTARPVTKPKPCTFNLVYTCHSFTCRRLATNMRRSSPTTATARRNRLRKSKTALLLIRSERGITHRHRSFLVSCSFENLTFLRWIFCCRERSRSLFNRLHRASIAVYLQVQNVIWSHTDDN